MRLKKREKNSVRWRARLKVTYYVMTFTFNQTNVECPIYIHITRRYYYLTTTQLLLYYTVILIITH